MPELRVLNLGSLELQALPPAIGKLGDLEALTLYNMPLKDLPPEFANLHALKFLSRSG